MHISYIRYSCYDEVLHLHLSICSDSPALGLWNGVLRWRCLIMPIILSFSFIIFLTLSVTFSAHCPHSNMQNVEEPDTHSLTLSHMHTCVCCCLLRCQISIHLKLAPLWHPANSNHTFGHEIQVHHPVDTRALSLTLHIAWALEGGLAKPNFNQMKGCVLKHTPVGISSACLRVTEGPELKSWTI